MSVWRIYMYTWKNRDWFRCLYEGSIHERIDIGFDVCMKVMHMKEQTLVSMSVWRIYTQKNRRWFRCLYEGSTCTHERTEIGFHAHIKIYMYTWKNRYCFRCLYERSTHERIGIGFDVYMEVLHMKEQTLVSMSVWRIYIWKNRHWFRCLYEGSICTHERLVSTSVWRIYTWTNRHRQ